jgi:hypothetical protein
VIYLEADYVIDAGAKSLTARVGGRYDTNVGEAALYGFVSHGYLRGAKVLDVFHDSQPGCVAGTLTITPWHLDDEEGDD